MKHDKSRPNPENTHVGDGGRIYQEQGKTGKSGQPKGHDLLNTDSDTAGVGSEIRSPGEAREIDEARESDSSNKQV